MVSRLTKSEIKSCVQEAVAPFVKIAEKNAMHIEVLNEETGELRDMVKEISKELQTKVSKNAENINEIVISLKMVQNDLEWIKRTYWIVASSSIGAVLMGLFNVLFK